MSRYDKFGDLPLFAPDPFDRAAGERLKLDGMQRAAEHSTWLDVAREVAKRIARSNPERETHSDEVAVALMDMGGPTSLGPAAGSLFKGHEWEFTGRRIRSARISNHARELKVWRLTR